METEKESLSKSHQEATIPGNQSQMKTVQNRAMFFMNINAKTSLISKIRGERDESVIRNTCCTIMRARVWILSMLVTPALKGTKTRISEDCWFLA